MLRFILLTVIISLATLSAEANIGFGKDSEGGSGKSIYFVTNTNASGPGSFAQGYNDPSVGYILFRLPAGVSTVIRQDAILPNRTGRLRISGQTQTGAPPVFRGSLSLQASHFFIEGMVFALGDDLSIRPDDSKAIEIWPPTRATQDAAHILIRRNEFYFGIDTQGGIGTSSDTYGSHHITYSENIAGWGLLNSTHSKGPHSMGVTFNAQSWHSNTAVRNLTLHCRHRHFNFNGTVDNEGINNVSYNGSLNAGWQNISSDANLIGNYYKPGPNSVFGGPVVSVQDGRLYAFDNYVEGRGGDNWARLTDAPRNLELLTPTGLSGIQAMSPADAYVYVLEHAGTGRGGLRERAIQDVLNGWGEIIDSQAEVAFPDGYSYIADPPRPDEDNDGIWDGWERAKTGTDRLDLIGSFTDYNSNGRYDIDDYLDALWYFESPSYKEPKREQ